MKVAELRDLVAGIPDHADVLIEAVLDCRCGRFCDCDKVVSSVQDAERSNVQGCAFVLYTAEIKQEQPQPIDVPQTDVPKKLVTHLITQMQRDPRLAFLIGPGSQTFELLGNLAQDAGQADQFREMEAGLKFEPWPNTRALAEAIETLLGISEESEYMSQKEREHFAREALKAQAQR